MPFPLKQLLAFMPGSILVTLSSIDIEDEDDDRLLLNADERLIELKKSSQMVAYAGGPFLHFASIESVNVTRFVNGKRFEWYVLSFRLRGGGNLTIGRSTDGVQVSIIAAHIAGLTGRSVRAIEKTGF
jgi:hypothetical protein